MSEIPSDVAASAAQAGFQGREVAKEREARRAGQADAVQRQVKTVDEAGNTVETTDQDAAVFTDAEGGGSEGREHEEAGPETGEAKKPPTNNGITRDDDGQLHVDIEV